MAADTTYQTKIQERNGGDLLAVASGGTFDIETGGVLSFNGVDKTAALAAATATPTAGVAAGYKVARGQLSTASAVDTVVTGLATVISVVATLEDDPIDTCSLASAQVGNQAGLPAAGSVYVKTWKPTVGGAAGNPTLIAASAFTKKVNWIAVGN